MAKTIDINELAIKLNETLENYDFYGYKDADGCLETALNDIKTDPLAVINGLCDMVNDLIDQQQ